MVTKQEEFTQKIASHILDMIAEGYHPVLGEVVRGQMQQAYYYLTGKSKIDGLVNLGNHQHGKAADIRFVDENGKDDWTESKYNYWHIKWQEKYGGKPMIIFKDGTKDLPHYELPD